MQITRQWQRDNFGSGEPWTAIPGATNLTYIPVGDDVGCRLRCIETATNVTGSSPKITNVTDIVQSASVRPAFVPSVARTRDRIAFGGPQDEAEIIALGVEQYIDRQLNPAFHDVNTKRKYQTWPLGFEMVDYHFSDDLGPQALHVARLAGSRQNVQSMMHEFWVNHFVTGYQIRANTRFAGLTAFDDACFKKGLGNAAELGKHFLRTAVLQYFMDNYLNIAGAPNENLGREVLELFFLGIGDEDEPPHYDQVVDVIECTRLFSGQGTRTIKKDEAGFKIDDDPLHIRGPYTRGDKQFGEDEPAIYWNNATGVHQYNSHQQTGWHWPKLHDHDPKFFTFFPGFEFSSAKQGRGVEGYYLCPEASLFIDMLATHRPAARFMCTKIAIWFMGVKPSPALREKMIDKWVETAKAPDQIAQVLRVLFFSEDFCGSYSTAKRTSTPIQYWAKFLNYFGEGFFSERDVAIIKGYCEKEEYNTLTYQTPAGFPDVPDYWLAPGHLAERAYRTGFSLPNNQNNQASFCVNYTGYLQGRGLNTPRKLIEDINHYWFGDRGTAAQLQTLYDHLAMPLDTVTDWNSEALRKKLQQLFRAVTSIDLSFYAA
jgi:uncharacterized protein (DUF1800 family)